MKHAVSIKDIRKIIKDADLDVTASKSGNGEILVSSDNASNIPALAVMCKMRNMYFDLVKTSNGKYVGFIVTKYLMEDAQ
jgi:hypothetical protein